MRNIRNNLKIFIPIVNVIKKYIVPLRFDSIKFSNYEYKKFTRKNYYAVSFLTGSHKVREIELIGTKIGILINGRVL